ncbi:putative Arrestin (or S-antigen), N-terminal domain containing protein [Leishmania naiffi]|uniref:Arrestin (Or S-antigen), N-terminal domain containing protein n=1 Tax=Leishmania naiffi TaxID=5678 RepID=A0AAW3B869_9TRYP
MPSSRGVSLSISVTETEVAPGGVLHGEVTVKVDASHKSGIVYEAIRLVFLAVEKSCVWDDQGEFDALLNEYTSSRVYLDRHVTLAGFKTQTEDAETAAQVREEMLFLQHCATPYAAVAPAKPKMSAYRHYTRAEVLHSSIQMAATTTHTTGGAVVPDTSAENHNFVGSKEPILGDDGPRSTRATSGEGAAEVEFPVLMPGAHRFPFMFRLPPWLPPSFYYSFAGAKGHLKYSASATMLFPANGAGSWWFNMRNDMSETTRDAEKAFNRATGAGAPSGEGERKRPGGGRSEEVGIDLDSVLVDERTNRRLTNIPSCSPSDLKISIHFDVLSVMPRRQLVAEYYQIDAHNLHQRPTNAPHESGGRTRKSQRRSDKGSDCGGMKPTDVSTGVLEHHEDTHLALSALYQTFRCGWLRNMCCLQPQNALEAEVLVVGARTVLLADDIGASQALGVRPPTTPDYPQLGAPALHAPGIVPSPDLENAAPNTPWPVSGITLRVRVRNHCPTQTVQCVRVELKVMVKIFKSLKIPHTFPGLSYSSFDYTIPIPPGSQALFDVRLGLMPRFRRHEKDSELLLPPPGVRTANMTSNTFLQVSFPGMYTYIEEQEEAKGVVIMAETVDLNDEVLELPVRYS